jgi:hypothetical protein
MSCNECDGLGLIPFALEDNPKSDAEMTVDDMHFAVCLCPMGMQFRIAENNGRRVSPQWVLWAYRNGVDVSRMALVENVFSPDRLAAAGFNRPAVPMNREAAMLAAGKRRK